MNPSRSTTRTFRISGTQKILLASHPYMDNASLLVRILLDDYFNGKLPDTKKKFDMAVSRLNMQKISQKAARRTA